MLGSKYMLVHSLASKYARFVVLGRLMYWTPPPIRPLDPPPLLKSDDLFFREPRDIGPPLSKILDTPLLFLVVMVDTDDTRRITHDGRWTMAVVWHKLPKGELKI